MSEKRVSEGKRGYAKCGEGSESESNFGKGNYRKQEKGKYVK